MLGAQSIKKQIEAIAQRTISYSPQDGLTYFLTSNDPIANLIGVEMLSPMLAVNYREIRDNNRYISDEQCQLLKDLLAHNVSTVLRKRIIDNVLIPEFMMMIENSYSKPSSRLQELLFALESNSLEFCKDVAESLMGTVSSDFFSIGALQFIESVLKVIDTHFSIPFQNLELWHHFHQLSAQKQSDFNKMKELRFSQPLQEALTRYRDARNNSFNGPMEDYSFFKYAAPLWLYEEKANPQRWNSWNWELFFSPFIEIEKNYDLSFSTSFFSFNHKMEKENLIKKVEKDRYVLLHMIPDAINMGWTADQFRKIAGSYLQDRDAADPNILRAFTFLLRTVACMKQISSDKKFDLIYQAATKPLNTHELKQQASLLISQSYGLQEKPSFRKNCKRSISVK